jgi:hypothetical protein
MPPPSPSTLQMYIRLHRPGPRRRAALRALSAACLVGSCLGAIGSIRLIIGSWSDFKLFGAVSSLHASCGGAGMQRAHCLAHAGGSMRQSIKSHSSGCRRLPLQN